MKGELVTTLLQILLNYGPAAYTAAVEIAHHPNPTKDDFIALGNSVSQESYDSIIAARRAAAGVQ